MERNNRSTRSTRNEGTETGRSSARDEGRGQGRDKDRGSTRESSRDTNSKRGSTRGSQKGFEYHRPTIEGTKKRSEQRGGNEFDSIFKQNTKVFKVNDDNVLRLIPPTWPEPKHFGFDIFVHYGVGPDGQTYLCPKEMLGEPCPVCEERARAVKDGDDDYAKELKPSKRVVYYVIDRDAEKEGVQIWAAPWTVDRDINTLIVDKRSGEVLAIDDPENGYDIEFSRTGKQLTTKYIGMQIARRESELGDSKWLDYAVDTPIPEQLAYFDYDHIAKVFGGQTSKKDEDLDDKQERGLRGTEERSSRGGSKTDASLTYEGIHGMSYEELCIIIEDEGLKIEPKDSTNDEELASWICEDLKLTKKANRQEEENPRDKLRKMREGRD